MLKKKMKALASQKKVPGSEKHFEVISDAAAASLFGGYSEDCQKLKNCGEFHGTCNTLETCGKYTEPSIS
ncbi:hypothetical protein HF324_17035 [Chitinophaga oryzae]|uniref:Uncharacterized protein n=1 Tax=Chitinophaga oryzae TaxID=2725414 RepID=A0ABX6LI74_9BACT|nr:hypothetical protein [Chitinophaga oryzae]QJB39468.1 hypothetical protein HF324_17035 [Chitinophaga oryzae]